MGALGQGEGKSDEKKYKRKNMKERAIKGKKRGKIGKIRRRKRGEKGEITKHRKDGELKKAFQ